MIKPLSNAVWSLSLVVWGLTACAPVLEKKQAQLDTASIKRIEFKIGAVKSGGLTTKLAQQNVAERISANLAAWGYPVGVKDERIFSHSLSAEIGLIKHGDTPTGFSFSAGNSDPRAIDFQKTDVLPISCELASIANPEQSAYLHMDFAAEGGFSEQALSTNKLVDHIGTVCFNLLNELNWPDKAQNQPVSSAKPTWIPEVRIETVSPPTASEKADVSGKTVTGNSEGRKQIIIHNQGSPLILNFGHERR